MSYLLLWWLLTVRDVAVYGCQTSPHLRLASQLSHHHQVSCGGLWASQDFPLPTGVRLLCQAATLLGPALTRGLCIVFILVEPFCAPFPSGLRGSRKCWHRGGLPTPVLQPRLPRHQAGLKSPFVIKVLWGPLGIFSKGGERSPPPSGGLVPCFRHRNPDSCTAFALIADAVLTSWR